MLKTKSSKSQLKIKILSALRRGFALCNLRFESKQGFTLLETIIALGVILAAAVGPVSLVTSGLSDFVFSKNKLVALNLAQEGIELARLVRDNNIVCDSINGAPLWRWNEDPEPPNPGNSFVDVTVGISVDHTITIDCGGVSGASLVTPILSLSCVDKLRFDPSTGIYGYTGGQETIFKRCVRILTPPVCSDPGSNPPDKDCPDSDVPVFDAGGISTQMDIISTVEWSERGMARSVKLRERLYNWR